ncbi:hypothetical protein [Ensifer canadensis]|uniref:hypothetical protein n=1 Tax=Ensifer canadensis TaxID=555315 RepID=UPI001AEDDDC6|nr:hypothetical protein [Ensifer canadensis]
MPGFILGFIHDFKHGISAISNHSVPLLSMKEHVSRPRSEKERGLFVALRSVRQPIYGKPSDKDAGFYVSGT